MKKQIKNIDLDEIDRKIEQRRQSLGLAARNKSYSEYNPGHTKKELIPNSYQNLNQSKPFEVMNDDLDRRIAEIRKKYSEYTQSNLDYPLKKSINTTAHLRSSNAMLDKAKRYNESYSKYNFDISSSQNENPEFGNRFGSDLTMKKMSSDY